MQSSDSNAALEEEDGKGREEGSPSFAATVVGAGVVPGRLPFRRRSEIPRGHASSRRGPPPPPPPLPAGWLVALSLRKEALIAQEVFLVGQRAEGRGRGAGDGDKDGGWQRCCLPTTPTATATSHHHRSPPSAHWLSDVVNSTWHRHAGVSSAPKGVWFSKPTHRSIN